MGSSLLLAVIPGPVVLYVVARSLSLGRRAGLVSVAGASTGSLVNGIAAALGLAALLAASTALYSLVKYAGAAYLIYLGVKTLLASSEGPASVGANEAIDAALRDQTIRSVPMWPLFRDGFIVALFNPKTIIFFSAFLPQFMTEQVSGGAAAAQAAILSALFVLIASASDATYALAAGAIAPRLAQRRGAGALGRTVAGCSFIGLGLFAAMSDKKS